MSSFTGPELQAARLRFALDLLDRTDTRIECLIASPPTLASTSHANAHEESP